ncbi:hypothetical protein [Kocuria carniphila]|uniref:hypothetical protein n=1 Tax=Kocuria carniphila TaxID=262208 RepID=UPI00101C19EC|nr:hypothetical protein [Kocuria carniphila]
MNTSSRGAKIMGDILNASTVPRALAWGFLVSMFGLGFLSFLNQLDGPRDVTLYNIVLAIFIGIVNGSSAVILRQRRFQRLREQGKVDADATPGDLQAVRPPRTLGEVLLIVLLATFAIRGLAALLAFIGPWPQLVAEWNTWLTPFLIAVFVGVGSFVIGKRHRAPKSSEPKPRSTDSG